MLVTSVIRSVDLDVSVALTSVGDSVTWLFNECDMCVLLGTSETASVPADAVFVFNCGVGEGAGEEMRHGMRKLTSTTQHSHGPSCSKG